jgi:hypothetical protein
MNARFDFAADDAADTIRQAVADAYAAARAGTLTPADVHAASSCQLADDERAQLATMTADELADEINFFADYQG